MAKIKLVICLAFLLVCFFILSNTSNAAGPTYISYSVDNSDPWTKENSPYIVQNHVVVKASLIIEAGTVVKFTTSLADLTIQNDFYVKGTREEPVIFTSVHDDDSDGNNSDNSSTRPKLGDWSALNFNPSQDNILDVRHAKVMYSAFGISIYSSNDHHKNRTVKNCELKSNGYGVVVYNAEPVIENNTISNNQFGIAVNSSSRVTKITNNAIYDNETGAKGNNPTNPDIGALNARYNWWGDESGPENNADNPDGKGNPVTGKVLFDPWIEEDPIETPDPVVIIPGIMGSWEKDGKWRIDPIFHTYDDLLKAFVNAGYKDDGKSMSVFPYQWRDSNIENAKLLHKRIQDIKKDTGRPKIDIVAHSMGGLLAREYIESNYYEDDVDQLITVGTPHLGAPKDYVTWEGGEFTGPWGFAFKRIFSHEAEENRYSDIFNYIQNRPIISVQELLPNYNYLFEKKNNYKLRESYPVNYPANNFLDNLNNKDKIRLLDEIEFYNIIGKLSGNQSTISGFNIIDSDDDKLWKHGYPENFWFVAGSRGFTRSQGDGTVPLYSVEASDIQTDKVIYFESEHSALPTDAQQDILEILTGKKPAKKIDEWQIDDILWGAVFSPVDFQIVSPSGKRLGKNFETGGIYNEIEGAYYTGFGTNTEFFTIPNPKDGEYKVSTQGVGSGEYAVEIAKIANNTDTVDKAEETIVGNAVPGKQEEAVVKVEGMKVEKKTIIETEDKNDSEDSNDSSNVGDNSGEDIAGQNQTHVQNLDVLKGKVNQFFKEGKIKKRKEVKKITEKLNHIRMYLKRYETKTSPKGLRTARRKANWDIEKLISRINKKSPKIITEDSKYFLIGDLNNLKIQ